MIHVSSSVIHVRGSLGLPHTILYYGIKPVSAVVTVYFVPTYSRSHRYSTASSTETKKKE